MDDTTPQDTVQISQGIDGLLMEAWGVIANAPAPAWHDDPSVKEWREAAERWRDRWHTYLDWSLHHT